MSRLELHDCHDHFNCTIISSDGPADDAHVTGDVLPVLNQSYPHYDYRGGLDGIDEAWGSPAPIEAAEVDPAVFIDELINAPGLDAALRDALISALSSARSKS